MDQDQPASGNEQQLERDENLASELSPDASPTAESPSDEVATQQLPTDDTDADELGDRPEATAGGDSADDTSDPADQQSDPFIGRWNKLVSTTNWEKGRIIHEWRAALIAVNAPITEYSDETWSQMVGASVSGQHAGRLRRVYERFGDVHDQYSGLFWSHFQAAVDWDDAEMWLEGAVQNRWSVAVVRRKRWETMGGVKEDEPQAKDVVDAEVDEDFSGDAASTDGSSTDAAKNRADNSMVAEDYEAEARSPAGPDFGDEDDSRDAGPRDATTHDDGANGDAGMAPSEPALRPFANLPDLPEDLTAAVESFQLAILRQKTAEWAEVSCEDVLLCLNALKTLALASPE